MPPKHWILEPSEQSIREYHNLQNTCGLLETSERGRICLTGEDRVSFLHGQITQDIKSLNQGQGAFAALVDAKGKIQSDLNVYILKDEILLDFEKGYSETITQRLEHHLVSEDVDLIDPSEFYSMLSVQGPESEKVLIGVFPELSLPLENWHFQETLHGEESIYVCRRPRFGSLGFDLFVPVSIYDVIYSNLNSAVDGLGGSLIGQEASEMARISAGIPKMGIDMTPDHLVQETGLTDSTISFRKGCYIGQEVISRIRTVGKVNKSLCRLAFDSKNLTSETPDLTADGKDAGFVTSLARLPDSDGGVQGLGYVKRSFLENDDSLVLGANGNSPVRVRILGGPSPTGHHS